MGRRVAAGLTGAALLVTVGGALAAVSSGGFATPTGTVAADHGAPATPPGAATAVPRSSGSDAGRGPDRGATTATRTIRGDPVPGALRLRAPGGLDDEVVAAVAGLPGVVEVVVSRSDTLGLLGSRAADGTPVDRFADGYRVPVAVTAIDPRTVALVLRAEAATTVDADVRATVASLSPGGALLSESSARLRRLGVGGRLDLDGRDDLEVVAVVPDEALRRAEIAVHVDDAPALGLTGGGVLTVVHDAAPGAATSALEQALLALVPTPSAARVARSGGAPSGSGGPLVLSLPERKLAFGEFAYRPRDGVREIDIDPAFVDGRIVAARMPQLGTVRCHEAIIGDLRRAIDEAIAAGLGSWLAPDRYGGCFHARRIAVGRDRLSSHSWGIAIDLNVDLSQPGLGPVPPEELIDVFGRNGFRWGGDFTTPDNHHWEWVGEAATLRRPR